MNRNICKFPQASLHSQLSISCFVMETDAKIMQCSLTLKSNRMILVIRGEGILYFNDHPHPFSSGDLLFGFEGECVRGSDCNDVAYLYVDFGGGRATDLFYRFQIHKGNRIFKGYDGLIPLWRDSLSRAQENTVDLAAESTLLYSFSRLSSPATEHSTLVDKVLRLTEESFTDSELSIGKIAKELSYNPKYLSHAFKQTMSVSYSEYLRDLRIKYAISLFNEGLDSIKNVSLLSGFSDALYFSNVFKKSVGRSPRDYLLTLRGSYAEKE